MTHKHQLIGLPGDDLVQNGESPQRSWKGYEVIDVFTGFKNLCIYSLILGLLSFYYVPNNAFRLSSV